MLKGYIEKLLYNDDERLFAICDINTEAHIGNIKLGPINWHHKFADVGIIIGDKKQWGKGRAVEAIRTLCRFGFDELGLNKITAGCYSGNQGSVFFFLYARDSNKRAFSKEIRLR